MLPLVTKLVALGTSLDWTVRRVLVEDPSQMSVVLCAIHNFGVWVLVPQVIATSFDFQLKSIQILIE